MKTKIITGLLLVTLLLLTGCGETTLTEEANSDYVGTWMRQGTYTNGAFVSSESATLTFTEGSFDSYNSYCSNSGSIEVTVNTMVWVVEQSDCPSIISVGSTVTSTYSVEGSTLTTINTEYGAEVKEIYNKA
ncbi:hypothetical protein HOD38_04275 [archaeon]|jgi:hypothetical protein|nr:hypothetical protein [archaeon]MBT4397458.1 hypothetical protein [archaeon]MBT4440530.1 hypothetical protein [archaeon]